MTTECATEHVSLILSPWMSVEQLDETTATIYLSSDGTRIRIPLSLHRLLLRFTTATDPDALCSVNDTHGHVARAIAQLKAKGFLVSALSVPMAKARQISDPPVRMFDVPAQRLAPARADVVVLGMPWDFGTREAAGARRGPLAIREVSLQMLYGLDRQTGRPQGWFDADRRRHVLAGVSIVDAGDVIVHHGERRTSFFDRSHDVLETLTREGALPVLLGGDASIAYPVIKQLQQSGPLAVIRIGRSPLGSMKDASVSLTGASLATHAIKLPFVSHYIQIVPRDSDDIGAAGPDGYAQMSIHDALSTVDGSLDRRMDAGQRVHVGIDVDALAHAGNKSSKFAFTYRDIHALLGLIGGNYRISSIDLCGVNPWAPCWGAVSVTALHLLLTALSAAKDPK